MRNSTADQVSRPTGCCASCLTPPGDNAHSSANERVTLYHPPLPQQQHTPRALRQRANVAVLASKCRPHAWPAHHRNVTARSTVLPLLNVLYKSLPKVHMQIGMPIVAKASCQIMVVFAVRATPFQISTSAVECQCITNQRPGFRCSKHRGKVHGGSERSSGVRAVCALSLDQVLYSALDLFRICMEVRKQLLCGLRYKLLMGETPSHLHDADYSCVDLKRSIHLDNLRATRRVNQLDAQRRVELRHYPYLLCSVRLFLGILRHRLRERHLVCGWCPCYVPGQRIISIGICPR
eukprot:COSAG02_NODE_4956_length_4782_cov_4.343370_2_plen_293_part_00